MTTGKTIALTRQTFVDKVMSLLFNMLSAAESLQSCLTAGVQPRWIQGIRSRDGVGEDQETIA